MEKNATRTRSRQRQQKRKRLRGNAGMPKGMTGRLKALAQNRGMSFRQMMIEILERELEN